MRDLFATRFGSVLFVLYPRTGAARLRGGPRRGVALVISPYALDNAFADRQRQLTDAGYVKRAEFNPATPRVEIYVRP